jgi:hypothetical protein
VTARPPGSSSAHNKLKHEILGELGARSDVRVFDNEVGRAFDPQTGAYIQFGLCRGSSDIIGIVSPSGRFLALEVKTGNAGASREQRNFLAMVNRMNGVGRIVRSVAEAQAAADEAAL